MKTTIAALAVVIGLVVGITGVGFASPGSTALAQHDLPGMCNGRTDPNVHINATANGPGAYKYILNIKTDVAGDRSGRLILGQGAGRITVDDWCRVWQHLPGQAYGACGADIPEGAVTAHAVGIASHAGEQLLVRTDLRETHEGKFFRVRYRTIGEHDADHEGGGGGHEDGEEGCSDESWTRIPAGEGWAALNSLTVRSDITSHPGGGGGGGHEPGAEALSVGVDFTSAAEENTPAGAPATTATDDPAQVVDTAAAQEAGTEPAQPPATPAADTTVSDGGDTTPAKINNGNGRTDVPAPNANGRADKPPKD